MANREVLANAFESLLRQHGANSPIDLLYQRATLQVCSHQGGGLRRP